jgi:hypothetical protein
MFLWGLRNPQVNERCKVFYESRTVTSARHFTTVLLYPRKQTSRSARETETLHRLQATSAPCSTWLFNNSPETEVKTSRLLIISQFSL